MERVTTGTYNLVSVILSVAPVGAFITDLAGLPPSAGTTACVVISVKTQFPDHIKIIFTSQLINGLSKVLQKLLKYLMALKS